MKLSQRDIDEISRLGYSGFFEFDEDIMSPVLKRSGIGCVFFREDKRDGSSSCLIYDARPEVCRKYPFMGADAVEDCRPDTLARRFGMR